MFMVEQVEQAMLGTKEVKALKVDEMEMVMVRKAEQVASVLQEVMVTPAAAQLYVRHYQ